MRPTDYRAPWRIFIMAPLITLSWIPNKSILLKFEIGNPNYLCKGGVGHPDNRSTNRILNLATLITFVRVESDTLSTEQLIEY